MYPDCDFGGLGLGRLEVWLPWLDCEVMVKDLVRPSGKDFLAVFWVAEAYYVVSQANIYDVKALLYFPVPVEACSGGEEADGFAQKFNNDGIPPRVA